MGVELAIQRATKEDVGARAAHQRVDANAALSTLCVSTDLLKLPARNHRPPRRRRC